VAGETCHVFLCAAILESNRSSALLFYQPDISKEFISWLFSGNKQVSKYCQQTQNLLTQLPNYIASELALLEIN
jgi:hypothetical protein